MAEIVAAEIVERAPASSPDLAVAAARSLGREFVAVLLAVVLCDVTLYRGQGFAGCALLFLLGAGRVAAGLSSAPAESRLCDRRRHAPAAGGATGLARLRLGCRRRICPDRRRRDVPGGTASVRGGFAGLCSADHGCRRAGIGSPGEVGIPRGAAPAAVLLAEHRLAAGRAAGVRHAVRLGQSGPGHIVQDLAGLGVEHAVGIAGRIAADLDGGPGLDRRSLGDGRSAAAGLEGIAAGAVLGRSAKFLGRGCRSLPLPACIRQSAIRWPPSSRCSPCTWASSSRRCGFVSSRPAFTTPVMPTKALLG